MYLKVAQGLFRKSVERNLNKQVLFFYKLKTINDTGSFNSTNIFSQIKNHCHCTRNTAMKFIDQLIELKWILKDSKGNYRLISYDNLFVYFGYDLSYNHAKTRKGTFLIFKIEFKYAKYLKLRIAYCELRRNLKEQRTRVRFSDAAPKHTKAVDLKEYLQKDRTHIKNRTLARFSRNYQLAKYGEVEQTYNSDVAITCETFANLLGYCSASIGCQIQNTLQSLKWIEKINRRVYSGFYDGQKLEYGQFVKDHLIYTQLPNQIFCLD